MTTERCALLSGGFRPFFLLASAWAAIALPAMFWHGHEMVFGFGLAALAGFLLTAIPNWTGRLPVRGVPLALLAMLWLAGRIAMLVPGAALLDLAFPAALIAVVARELIAGRNWRNLPLLAALALLFAGNLLFHLGIYAGLRLGIATLLMLIALVGGRIVPSFTRNWLAKRRAGAALPAPEGWLDRIALLITLAALVAWVCADLTSPALAAGVALALRLSRWRSASVLREPLLLVLHLGYAWLAFGLMLLGLEAPAALHALTVGAIGTMSAIYVLITLAALVRVASPWMGALAVSLSGVAWSAAFAAFVLHYGRFLIAVDPDQTALRARP